ncbi:tyrosinase-like protein [Podospora aff. communis PSN243]|uniref:Tyrosinase-like protein n=1 Tax=Podospora aff. communis PSN243 TaxID=3040156 RepID=A0AAV9GQ68_9PEZI|nr:tyrosinase-like protein [Podospora aff. communis PSN243]
MFAKTSLCFAAAATAVSGFSIPNFGQLAVDSGLALSGLNSIALLNSLTKTQGTCNVGNIKIRQEWRTLSTAQRKNFISAVNCLTTKPSILPPGTVPGAHSIYDDFTWVHVRLTNNVHQTGNFLTWHRYFIHIYEQKLKECGYNGNLPYWEWGFDVNSPKDSPVFDGSDTSLGSDGETIDHLPLILSFPQPDGSFNTLTIPPGTGGGCVNRGPFSNLTLHLGPVVLPEYGSPVVNFNPFPERDNPRCLKRDLSSWVAKQWTSFRNTTDLILQSSNIFEFTTEMNGDPRFTSNVLGVHGGGHFTIGGDPGGDPFIAPGDPAFWLHHAQVDRVYWIWQMLDFQNRQTLFGTNTFLDQPPSANTTVEDFLDMDPLGPDVKIKDVLNTVGGPLCYVYI